VSRHERSDRRRGDPPRPLSPGAVVLWDVEIGIVIARLLEDGRYARGALSSHRHDRAPQPRAQELVVVVDELQAEQGAVEPGKARREERTERDLSLLGARSGPTETSASPPGRSGGTTVDSIVGPDRRLAIVNSRDPVFACGDGRALACGGPCLPGGGRDSAPRWRRTGAVQEGVLWLPAAGRPAAARPPKRLAWCPQHGLPHGLPHGLLYGLLDGLPRGLPHGHAARTLAPPAWRRGGVLVQDGAAARQHRR
jgi:hypothetical protein